MERKKITDPEKIENIKKLRRARIISELMQYEVNNSTVSISETPHNIFFGKWNEVKVSHNNEMKIIVTDEDSFGCVLNHREEMDDKRILVLNFANPYVPGGGVRTGARAQEEDLCRRSNLLQALEDDTAAKYYENNKEERAFSYGYEVCLITKGVSIFVDSAGKLLQNPVVVDVMTAAAPKLSGKTGLVIPGQVVQLKSGDWVPKGEDTPYGDFVEDEDCARCSDELDFINTSLFDELIPPVYGTIENICEMILSIAEQEGYKTIVLGAFGCGAFKNDPRDVANAFKKALATKSFDKVYFPILKRHERGRINYEVFSEILGC